MKLSSMLSALHVFAAGALLCAPTVAQTRFCLGGDLDHLTATQKATCSAKMQTIRNIATALHAPSDWHFVMVCGEEGWKQYTAYAMREESILENATADTNYEAHETFFRESRIDAGSSASLQSSVSLEIAGILSHNDLGSSVDGITGHAATIRRTTSGL